MEPLRRTFRGYDPAQVETLLAELRMQIEESKREIDLLRSQNSELSSKNVDLDEALNELKTDEEAVREALVSAHQKSEEILSTARNEAEIILQVARESASRLQEVLRGRISDLNWQIERLSLQRRKLHDELKELLESFLTQLLEPAQPRLEMNMEQELPTEAFASAITESEPSPEAAT